MLRRFNSALTRINFFKLTNRKRIFILIFFWICTEMYCINIMRNIPDNPMANREVRSVVHSLESLPKIRNLQKMAEQGVVPDYMPYFHAKLFHWYFYAGTLVAFLCRGLRVKNGLNSPKTLFQWFCAIALPLILIFVSLKSSFFDPREGAQYLDGVSAVYYKGGKWHTAIITGHRITFLYVILMYILLNISSYIEFLLNGKER